MPDLQDKDVQRVTKKMQFAFRSKKPPVTPPKPSKPQMMVEEPQKPLKPYEEPAGEDEEELPDLSDKEVQAVTKKMQFAFRSKKSPKAKVEVPASDPALPVSVPAVPVSVPAVPLPVSVPATAVLLKLADEKSSSPEKSERISEAKSVSSQRSSSTEEKSSADRSTAESEKSSVNRSTADKSSGRSSAAADRSSDDKSTADRSTAEKQSIGEEEEMPDLQDKDVQRVTQKMQFAFRSKKSPQPPAEAIIKTDKEEIKISFPREYPLEEKIALEKSYSKENITEPGK